MIKKRSNNQKAMLSTAVAGIALTISSALFAEVHTAADLNDSVEPTLRPPPCLEQPYAIEDPQLSLIDECDDPPPPPPPPVYAPYTPKYITYTPFTERGIVKLEWARSDRSGESSRYKVYQQKNNSYTWALVYDGYGLSKTVSGLTDGRYKYRVQACNSGGCSGYRSFIETRVSRADTSNNFLAAAKSSAAKMSTSSGSFDVAKLGYGFNDLSDTPLNSHCWATDSIKASEQAINNKDMEYQTVFTREELSTALGLEENANVNASYGEYSAEYSYSKELYSKTHSVETQGLIVAKLYDYRKHEYAKSQMQLAMDATAKNWLITGQKSNFRNECGDKYVEQTTLGRLAFVTIRLSSSDKSASEVKTTTNSLKVDLANYADGGYSSTEKQEIMNKYSSYSVHVLATTVGSTNGVVTMSDFTQLLNFLNAFESASTEEMVVVEYRTANYNIPSELSHLTHYQVYLDYRPYESLVRQWSNLDTQLQERCKYFDRSMFPAEVDGFISDAQYIGYSQLDHYCGTMKGLLAQKRQYCTEQQDWSLCVAPRSSSCTDAGSQCMTNANQIPRWYEGENKDELKFSLGTSLTAKTESKSVTMCLASNEIRNVTRGWNDCNATYCPNDVDGVGFTLNNGHNAKDSKLTYSSRCLTTWAEIRRPGWWKGSAKWDSDQTLHTLRATNDPYIF